MVAPVRTGPPPPSAAPPRKARDALAEADSMSKRRPSVEELLTQVRPSGGGSKVDADDDMDTQGVGGGTPVDLKVCVYVCVCVSPTI